MNCVYNIEDVTVDTVGTNRVKVQASLLTYEADILKINYDHIV